MSERERERIADDYFNLIESYRTKAPNRRRRGFLKLATPCCSVSSSPLFLSARELARETCCLPQVAWPSSEQHCAIHLRGTRAAAAPWWRNCASPVGGARHNGRQRWVRGIVASTYNSAVARGLPERAQQKAPMRATDSGEANQWTIKQVGRSAGNVAAEDEHDECTDAVAAGSHQSSFGERPLGRSLG